MQGWGVEEAVSGRVSRECLMPGAQGTPGTG